jgi:hypothetical protein
MRRHAYLILAVTCFSVLTVYAQYAFLETTDNVTHREFRELSLAQYHETLEGRRWFPFQWRVAAPWLVFLGERTTRLDPHVIDVAIKIVTLAVSTLALIEFTAKWTSAVGAITAGALFLTLTSVAFATEGYAIYYTNDYLLMMGWFLAVSLVTRGKLGWAALVTFLTAWAKETIVLVPVLIAFAYWRGKATARAVLLCVLAFVIPMIVLRTHYVAPLKYWAWWNNIERNVPLVRTEPNIILMTLRNNVKVLMFYNVLWVLAAQAVARTSVPLLRDLACVGAMYLMAAYVVVYVRELRHFLPLAIVVLPLAVMAIEEMVASPHTGRRPHVDAAD